VSPRALYTEALFFVPWFVMAVVTTTLTVRWVRAHSDSDAFDSLLRTAVAPLPGVVQSALCFCALFSGDGRYRASLLSLLFLGLWLLVGPAFLIAGLVARRHAQDIPRGTALVQASHGLLWVWSSLMLGVLAIAG
jgi:hypothetical protein